MGIKYLKKFKNIRLAAVEGRIGIEHKVNIRPVEVQLGLSETAIVIIICNQTFV